ncbi:MAG: GspE/PulE family protein [Candidatus Nanopelagicales bacterium]
MQTKPRSRRRLGDVLREWNEISENDLDTALRIQRTDPTRPRLGSILMRERLIDEQTLSAALAELHGLRIVDLDRMDINTDIAKRLDKARAQRYCALPLAEAQGQLIVAIADPFDIFTTDDLRARFGANVTLVVASRSQLEDHIGRVWGDTQRNDVLRNFVQNLPSRLPEAIVEPEEEHGAVRMVDQILTDAVAAHASDIHIEAAADGVRVRFRVDGVMNQALRLPAASLAPIIARVKVLSGLDVFQRRLPQDGRTRVTVNGRAVDLRVSTVPALHGENLVLRIMTQQSDLPRLEQMGLSWPQVELLSETMAASQGCVVVTGPTGSGKSTTLYALIAEYVGDDRHAITMEDPVEMEIGGITQIQIDESNGVTFPSALRASLRQDPDVVMVGEIRDPETAHMAISAALTGHLMLSTMHTLDAPSGLMRLVQLGVPRYLIADSLRIIMAQRLLRRPCAFCARPAPVNDETRRLLGLNPEQATTLVRGTGCEMCKDSGYLGRVGVFEILALTDTVRDAFVDGAGTEELTALAKAGGYLPLSVSASRLAVEGLTTAEEILRVVGTRQRHSHPVIPLPED